MSATKFFTDNLNRLPKGIGGTPEDPEKHNLYWGLLQLARQMDQIQQDQQQLMNEVRSVQQQVQRLR